MTEKSYRNGFSRFFTLVHHYVKLIEGRIDRIKSVTRYLAVDGYFMKAAFIEPLVKQGLHLITKTRSDANLMYVFRGKQKTGRGRKRLYDGKINISQIDKGRIACCYSDDDKKVYAAPVYCVFVQM